MNDIRFAFGENWRLFLDSLDDDRIAEAEKSLQALVGFSRLDGKSFLDIGSGSGLFSLVARRLGARVHSFDFDLASVNCAIALRNRYFPDDKSWTIERGSVLDPDYLRKLGTFDVVYSWGVLHHTGQMERAIELAAERVAPGGLFVFALYRKTRLCWAWKWEKRWYANASPRAQYFAQRVYIALMGLAFKLQGRNFQAYVTGYGVNRGMNYERDVSDWLGGYPYESIRSRDVGELMSRLELSCVRDAPASYPTGIFGSGCDEHVYRRTSNDERPSRDARTSSLS